MCQLDNMKPPIISVPNDCLVNLASRIDRTVRCPNISRLEVSYGLEKVFCASLSAMLGNFLSLEKERDNGVKGEYNRFLAYQCFFF